MNLQKVVVVCYKDNFGTKSLVKKTLMKNKVAFSCINRDILSVKNIRGADLIITVGGDGTFLRTAKFVDEQPVLAVNTNQRQSEGFFTRATKSDFEKKLDLILKGKYKIQKLSRLESTIDYSGKKKIIEKAVNEVFIGNKRPYLTSRYKLTINNKSEFQKSSGILISTSAGSSGWIRSAGGKRMPLNSKKIQYVVREAYRGRLTKPKLKGVILPENSVIKVKSLDWDGIIAVDSHHHEHPFKEGTSITVKQSNMPLNLVYL